MDINKKAKTLGKESDKNDTKNHATKQGSTINHKNEQSAKYENK